MATNCFQQPWKGDLLEWGTGLHQQIDTAVPAAPPRTTKCHQPHQDTGASLFLSGWRLQLPGLLLTAGEDGFNPPSEVTSLGKMGYRFLEQSSCLLNDSLICNSQWKKTAESEKKDFSKIVRYISLLLLCASSVKSYAQSFRNFFEKNQIAYVMEKGQTG